MIQRIKRGDKVYIISNEVDVVSRLKPNSVTNKYIELNTEDLIEVVKDVAGKTVRSLRLPELVYDCSSNKLKDQTFAVQFNPMYKLGLQWIESGKGENLMDDVSLPSGKMSDDLWLVRIYLLDADV